MDTAPASPRDVGADDGYGMMIFMDPPRHDELRHLVSRAFTPRRVASLESRARELCARFLDPQLDGSGFDYVEDFAAKIPTMVIGAMLGVPDGDQDQLRIWGDDMMRFEPDGLSAEKLEAMQRFSAYLQEMVDERRRKPRDDMVSDLLSAEITREDGSTRRLDNREVLEFFILLEMAGSETTARLLGWASVLLARHPDQRAKLVANRGLVPNAVEELLRYEAPSPIQARWVTRPVELHRVEIPADCKIALLTGSAGRDEREYPDADRFDVRRTMSRHASFGYGPHFCLGAALARLEARVALEETLARFPTWEIDESGLRWVHTSTVRGYETVPFSP
jgi:cytochrome P450